MSITFTDQLDKPSEITAIPNQLLRPIFGASYGFDVPVGGGGGTPAFANQYSVSFDGSDDYVDLGTSSSLNPTSALTLSAWINISGAGTGGLPTIYSSSKTSNGVSGGIALAYTSNKIRFYLDTTGSSGWVFAESDSTMSTGQWYHLVGTWDGSTVTLYVDGTAQTTTGSASTIGYSTGFSATIGRYTSDYFQGLIDEVALFDSALSAADRAALRDTSGSNPVPADISSLNPKPVGWWRMGDGSDGSGNADGTLVNIGGTDFPQIYNVATDGSGNRITGIDGSMTNFLSPNGIVTDVPS